MHSELYLLEPHIICFHDYSVDIIWLLAGSKDLERAIYFALFQKELGFEGGIPLLRDDRAGRAGGDVLVHGFEQTQVSQAVALHVHEVVRDVFFQ